MVGLKGYFIQYKVITPKSTSRASYTYQKIFRALYGYTQIIKKSNGKTYSYHREGVLSTIPHSKTGRNCVVIPKESLAVLLNFFKTGLNPAHKWQEKGDWKVVYYMDEKELTEEDVTNAIQRLIDRTYIFNSKGEQSKLVEELHLLREKQEIDPKTKKTILDRSQKIITHPWFAESKSKNPKLFDFFQLVNSLR